MAAPGTDVLKGRSPYDEVVDGEGQDDGDQPTQQYDHRGRPINPDTKRMNRDIIRAHNEVMLVIGVAEPENPFSGPEAESQRRHEAHEDEIGLRLGSLARNCIEAVGIFGIHGLRQRILVSSHGRNQPEPPASLTNSPARFTRDTLTSPFGTCSSKPGQVSHFLGTFSLVPLPAGLSVTWTGKNACRGWMEAEPPSLVSCKRICYSVRLADEKN